MRCNRKGCGNNIPVGAARNRLYCSDQCRWDCHHAPQLRRSNDRPEPMVESVSVRLTADEWNIVERLAAAKGMTRAAWIRSVVVAKLAGQVKR